MTQTATLDRPLLMQADQGIVTLTLNRPALLIFILVLPGAILRYTYRKGTWQSPIEYEPLSEDIPKSLFWAAVLHLGWGRALPYPPTIAKL